MADRKLWCRAEGRIVAEVRHGSSDQPSHMVDERRIRRCRLAIAPHLARLSKLASVMRACWAVRAGGQVGDVDRCCHRGLASRLLKSCATGEASLAPPRAPALPPRPSSPVLRPSPASVDGPRAWQATVCRRMTNENAWTTMPTTHDDKDVVLSFVCVAVPTKSIACFGSVCTTSSFPFPTGCLGFSAKSTLDGLVIE